MPIVGSIRTLGIDTLTGNVSERSHSTVFVTSPATLSIITDQNVPPLTTLHTPPGQCIDRYMYQPLGKNGAMVFSIDPSSSIKNDPLFKSRQLYQMPTYSPGTCPLGQTIAEVTAYRVNASNGAFRTLWQASCCKRFDTLSNHCNHLFHLPAAELY